VRAYENVFQAWWTHATHDPLATLTRVTLKIAGWKYFDHDMPALTHLTLEILPTGSVTLNTKHLPLLRKLHLSSHRQIGLRHEEDVLTIHQDLQELSLDRPQFPQTLELVGGASVHTFRISPWMMLEHECANRTRLEPLQPLLASCSEVVIGPILNNKSIHCTFPYDHSDTDLMADYHVSEEGHVEWESDVVSDHILNAIYHMRQTLEHFKVTMEYDTLSWPDLHTRIRDVVIQSPHPLLDVTIRLLRRGGWGGPEDSTLKTPGIALRYSACWQQQLDALQIEFAYAKKPPQALVFVRTELLEGIYQTPDVIYEYPPGALD